MGIVKVIFEIVHRQIKFRMPSAIRVLRPFIGEHYTLGPMMKQRLIEKWQETYRYTPPKGIANGWEVVDVRHHPDADWIEVVLSRD